jgi:phage N-6-adenine-methyltransferase
MPAQKPGSSRQDYETPAEFIAAVEARWGKLDIDLAAREDNKKAPACITPEDDSLAMDWCALACFHLWLNPPFARIGPWAKKCAELDIRLSRGTLNFLTPASVCANWFTDYVLEEARVYLLQPRPSFDGKAPFPKDVILSRYGDEPGFEVWRWK